MSEKFLDLLNGHTVIRQNAACCVSQVVEADGLKTILEQDLLEVLGYIIR